MDGPALLMEQETLDAERVRMADLAPRPRSMEETGLGSAHLNALLLKHLYRGGVLDLRELVRRVALPGSVIEPLLQFLRTEGLIEVRSTVGGSGNVRYALTAGGRENAMDALGKSGYVGPAPVPIERYAQIVAQQSFTGTPVSRNEVREAFSGTVIRADLLDQLGPALHSGRAIFLYGPPGTGKSYISRKLAGLLRGPVLVPYAVSVDETVVQFFDPAIHHPLPGLGGEGVEHRLTHGFDARFSLCQRPVAVTGGELTLDELELGYDSVTRTYRMPLHLRANNGMLVIDDLGRQRVAPVDLLNRWIVPMEEHRDFLNLHGGQHVSLPFDLVLIFSTNLNPMELADEAFLRRIGHKIRFDYIDRAEYHAIWRQECEKHGVDYQRDIVELLLEQFHSPNDVSLLPCHPRDLLELALDYHRYHEQPPVLTGEAVHWAWKNYFIQLH